ncbi:MAG: hypothetical protein EXS46_00230 [Candidatus Taylorbacteria bacterium]|nr:hypothetical protein [Candidatus Taylorbacteria bacterium]
MNQNMKWIWATVAVIAVIGLVLISKKDNVDPKISDIQNIVDPISTTTEAKEVKTEPVPVTVVKVPAVVKKTYRPAMVTKKPASNIIEYTNQGFKPSVLTIKQGESVEFLNTSDQTMVIRSHDESPDNFYPGFSQEGGPLGKGGKFFFAFTLPGTWLYYNLNGNKEQGAIVVK